MFRLCFCQEGSEVQFNEASLYFKLVPNSKINYPQKSTISNKKFWGWHIKFFHCYQCKLLVCIKHSDMHSHCIISLIKNALYTSWYSIKNIGIKYLSFSLCVLHPNSKKGFVITTISLVATQKSKDMSESLFTKKSITHVFF